MIGAGLAFLWYNAHPAQVFMGDVGALALGAMLGTIAVMVSTKKAVFANYRWCFRNGSCFSFLTNRITYACGISVCS